MDTSPPDPAQELGLTTEHLDGCDSTRWTGGRLVPVAHHGACRCRCGKLIAQESPGCTWHAARAEARAEALGADALLAGSASWTPDELDGLQERTRARMKAEGIPAGMFPELRGALGLPEPVSEASGRLLEAAAALQAGRLLTGSSSWTLAELDWLHQAIGLGPDWLESDWRAELLARIGGDVDAVALELDPDGLLAGEGALDHRLDSDYDRLLERSAAAGCDVPERYAARLPSDGTYEWLDEDVRLHATAPCRRAHPDTDRLCAWHQRLGAFVFVDAAGRSFRCLLEHGDEVGPPVMADRGQLAGEKCAGVYAGESVTYRCELAPGHPGSHRTAGGVDFVASAGSPPPAADDFLGRPAAAGEPWPGDRRGELAEAGRRLASERDDLVARGVPPSELDVPLHPDTAARAARHAADLPKDVSDARHDLANALGSQPGEVMAPWKSLLDQVRDLRRRSRDRGSW